MKSLFIGILLFCAQAVFSQDTVTFYDYTTGYSQFEIRQKSGFLENRTGVIIGKDSSGTKRFEANILDDSLHGHCRWFYETGILKDDEHYSKGYKQDTSRYYYPNGRLSSEEVYVYNQLDYFRLFNADGSIDTVSKRPGASAKTIEPSDLGIFLSKNMEKILSNLDDEEYMKRLEIEFHINAQGQTEKVIVYWGARSCSSCKTEMKGLSHVPSWTPMKNHNRPVACSLKIPIKF